MGTNAIDQTRYARRDIAIKLRIDSALPIPPEVYPALAEVVRSIEELGGQLDKIAEANEPDLPF